jgi:hypothetical protein
MTRDEIEQAVWAGVHPTLTEWTALEAEDRDDWAEASAGLLRSTLLTVVSAMCGPNEARATFARLRSEDSRIDAALVDAAMSAAKETTYGQ